MNKKCLLKCSILNKNEEWKEENICFDYIGEIAAFIKYGNAYIKPENVRVKEIFAGKNKLDIDDFFKFFKIKIQKSGKPLK